MGYTIKCIDGQWLPNHDHTAYGSTAEHIMYSKFKHPCNCQTTLKTTLVLLYKLFLCSCLWFIELTISVVLVLAAFLLQRCLNMLYNSSGLDGATFTHVCVDSSTTDPSNHICILVNVLQKSFEYIGTYLPIFDYSSAQKFYQGHAFGLIVYHLYSLLRSTTF